MYSLIHILMHSFNYLWIQFYYTINYYLYIKFIADTHISLFIHSFHNLYYHFCYLYTEYTTYNINVWLIRNNIASYLITFCYPIILFYGCATGHNSFVFYIVKQNMCIQWRCSFVCLMWCVEVDWEFWHSSNHSCS